MVLVRGLVLPGEARVRCTEGALFSTLFTWIWMSLSLLSTPSLLSQLVAAQPQALCSPSKQSPCLQLHPPPAHSLQPPSRLCPLSHHSTR